MLRVINGEGRGVTAFYRLPRLATLPTTYRLLLFDTAPRAPTLTLGILSTPAVNGCCLPVDGQMVSILR